MTHDYWLQPPEQCEQCGLNVCECEWEADLADRDYHEWRDQLLEDY